MSLDTFICRSLPRLNRVSPNRHPIPTKLSNHLQDDGYHSSSDKSCPWLTAPNRTLIARRAAVSVAMVHDVDDVAVWCSDEEPAHTPWLCSYRVYDLAAEFLSFFISTFDVIRVDGNDRVFGCGCI